MRYMLHLLYCIMLVATAGAQNLVPNPSFEDFNLCPKGLGEFSSIVVMSPKITVLNWVNPTANVTDYFNACTSVGTVSVPNNILGYLPAHSGQAYCGIEIFNSSVYPQNSNFSGAYIEAKFSSTMLAGKIYELSYYVHSGIQNKTLNQYALNKFYIALIDTLFTKPNTAILNFQNVVTLTKHDSSFVEPNNGWTKVSGYYVANGNEKFLIVGLFNHTSTPVAKFLEKGTLQNSTNSSYYAIDDVSVAPPIFCDTITRYFDTALCADKPFLIELTSAAPLSSNLFLWNTLERSASISIQKTGLYWCTAVKDCSLIIDTFQIRAFKDTIIKSFDTVACKNDIVLSSRFQGMSVKWNTGDTTHNITINSSGIFWCIAEQDCRLMVDTWHVIKIIDTIRKPIQRISYCANDTYALSPVSTGLRYLWSTGATTRTINATPGMTCTCYVFLDECTVVEESFLSFQTTPPSIYAKPLKDTIACGFFLLGEKYDRNPHTIWNTGDSNCCITVSKTGTYIVTITEQGCPPFNDTAIITIKDCDNCLSLPTAFTPNGDGLNDYFRPLISCPVEDFAFRIYNRFGQQVYFSTDYRSGWNGMHGASLADVGTYYHMLEYVNAITGKPVSLKGDILLVR